MPDQHVLPLTAFAQRLAEQPQQTYLTQPYPGGRLERLSFTEVDDQVRRVAAWLQSLQLPAGSRIAIISKNCAHWLISDLAIWMAGHVSVPLYPNLTAESVRQVLEHAEAQVAIIGKLDAWPSMAPGVPEGVITLAMPLAPEGAFDRTWQDALAHAPLSGAWQGQAEDLATIIYTSGTTGVPKGVMHNFANFAFTGSQAVSLFDVNRNDRVLSYLPLSHVAERVFVELASLYSGQQVFFAESLDTFMADLQRAKPTVFFAVPRIWSKFQMGVYERVSPKALNLLLKLSLLGARMGRKVLAGLGLNHVRYAVSGAAPLPDAVQRWYALLGLDVIEAYGMTENCGYSHIGRPDAPRQGWIGPNNPGVTVRLSDQGEVQVKSGATMLGYFKDPERTAEVLTADGFLRTGDKGEQSGDGYLRLTGRIKDIFKTSKGKYVAPAPIENRLAAHERLEQVCVAGDNLPQALGLCVLSEMAREQANSSDGRKALGQSLEQLLAHTNSQLDKHEQLHSLVVVSDVWAVENGFLTPTLKIKRNVVEDTYREHFERWSTQANKVQWHGFA
ncbi:AMP-binding protein [Atopomonas sediminilitoris]|uniref:AMP-binding protein n=1 Tax=Atopomonas sediminilitoris TaxID=2919919 RepID=UPI001F4E1034|nr:AMP-binding protein [Atopomonas sediminilitoris]MCJ8167767.1 AMP-binding protein [Atopomonas sediminilitoris]